MSKHPTRVGEHGSEAGRLAGAGAAIVWLPLASLFLGTFAVGTDGFMIAGLVPQIARDLSTSTAAAAQLVTVFAVCYALGAPVLAAIFARASRRTLLLAALAGLSAANAVGALAHGLVLLLVVRAAAVLAASLFTPVAAVAASGLVSARRQGRALSMITAGLTVSIVTGVPAGALIGDRFGWRATFAAVAIVSALVAAAARFALPRDLSCSPAAAIRTQVAALRVPGVSRVLATTASGILAGYLGYTYIAPVSHAGGASGSGALAVILACFGAGATGGALLSGIGADRLPQPVVLRTGALLQAAALVALAGLDLAGARLGTAPVAIAFAFLGAGSFNYGAPQQRRLIELAPGAATTLVSLNSSAIYAGIGLSGALGGLTLQAGPAANCLTGALIAAATAWAAAKRPRQASSHEQQPSARERHEQGRQPCPAY